MSPESKNPAWRDFPAHAKQSIDPHKIRESIKKCDEIGIDIARLKKALELQLAGAENLIQKTEKEKRIVEETENRIIVRLFDILDEIDNKNDSSIEFLYYIRIRLLDSLGREGIQRFTVLEGTSFDPMFHSTIQEISDLSLPDERIVKMVQCGYKKNDKILRKASVVKINNGGNYS